jgi:hypothetical protein
VRAGLGLSGFLFDCIALTALREQFGLLTRALRFLSKTMLKGLDLFETASFLHGLRLHAGKQPDKKRTNPWSGSALNWSWRVKGGCTPCAEGLQLLPGSLLRIGNGSLFQPFGWCNKENNMPTEPVNGREPDFSEDDIQGEELGPRGVPGKSDPAKMTPQRNKKMPKNVDPGHTA